MNDWQNNGMPVGQTQWQPSSGSASLPYQGGVPVRCPRCSNIVSTRYCAFCGLDLSCHYTIQQPANQIPANGVSYPYPPSSPSAAPTSSAPYSLIPPQSPAMGTPPPINTQRFPQGMPMQGASLPMQTPPGSYQGNYSPVGAPPQNNFSPSAGAPAMPMQMQGYSTVPRENEYPQNTMGSGTSAPYSMPYYNTASYGSRRNPRRTTLLICGISLASILFCLVMFFTIRGVYRRAIPESPSYPTYDYNLPNTDGYYHPEGISVEEYAKIKIGMSYAQASQIIGGDGQVADSGTTADDKIYYTYIWYGEDNANALVYITFVDSAITDITNEGLTNEY